MFDWDEDKLRHIAEHKSTPQRTQLSRSTQPASALAARLAEPKGLERRVYLQNLLYNALLQEQAAIEQLSEQSSAA
jgi:hypothetical protein